MHYKLFKNCFLPELNKSILLATLVFSTLHSCTGHEEKMTCISVIFDIDAGNDIDDVLTMQMLFNYEKAGKINLLGIIISKSNPCTIEYIDGHYRLNGGNDIPLGHAYNGVNPEDGNYLRQTIDTTIDGNKILFPQRSINNSIPEGYKLLRKMLAAQKDSPVVLIAVGSETNLTRLLTSEPDEYSTLNGKSLVTCKVRALSVMAGRSDERVDHPERNILQDPNAAQTTLKKWPTFIIAGGREIGTSILYPHQSILNDFLDSYKHLLCVSYKIYQRMPYDQETQDLTSALQTIEPESNHFNSSEKRIIIIDSTGQSIFSTPENGKHQYLIMQKEENTQTIIKVLVNQVAGKK